jgi:hypothetical protein
VGTVESDESNWRVSRLSAKGRRDRLDDAGFRIDMDQTPLFQEARLADRPGTQLDRRSGLGLNPIPSGTEELPEWAFLHTVLVVCNHTAVPDVTGDLVDLV